jgi:tetratricopeptide (TPR) repeat protein
VHRVSAIRNCQALQLSRGVAMSPLTTSSSICGRLLAAVMTGLLALASQVVSAQTNKSVDDLVLQAQTVMQKGHPNDAVNLLRRAIDQDPTRAELYLLRSRARDSAGKFEAAIDDASKYIELKPDDPAGYINRARIYSSAEKHREALEDANKAIAMAPQQPDGYYRRADIYNDMGKTAEAKSDELMAEKLDK